MDDLPHRSPRRIEPAGPLQGPLAVWYQAPGAEGTLVQTDAAGRPLQVGILEAMPGSGRHFYSPLEYETQFVKDEVGTAPRQDRRRGLQDRQAAARRNLPGRREGICGILRKVLTPGRYRINKYGFDVKIVDVDACAEPGPR